MLSVVVHFEFDKDMKLKITYAGIKIFSITPESEKKPTKKQTKKAEEKKLDKDAKKAADDIKKTAKEEKKDAQKAEDTAEKPKKQKAKVNNQDFSEKIELVKTMLSSASSPAKRLFKRIRVTDVYVDVIAGGEDAQQAALNYGKLNWAINGVLGNLDALLTLKVKKVNITVNFNSEEPEYYVSCKAKLRLGTALDCAIWFLFNIVKKTVKNNINTNGGHNYGRPSNSRANGHSNGENS